MSFYLEVVVPASLYVRFYETLRNLGMNSVAESHEYMVMSDTYFFQVYAANHEVLYRMLLAMLPTGVTVTVRKV